MIRFYREGPETSHALSYLQPAGAQQAGAQAAGAQAGPHSTWGLRSRPERAAGVAASLQFRQAGGDGNALCSKPQAGSQHLGAAQQPGRTALGGFAAGRSAAASRSRWQQQAFSSANRWRWHFGAHSQPQAAGAQARRGLHSRPEQRRPPERRALGGFAAGRSAAALLAARMAAGQLGLQPLQEVRTAALRHAAAGRLTALGGFAARCTGPSASRSRTALGGFAAGRGTAALLAAGDGSGPSPARQQVRTAALRSTCLGTTAGRLTSLGARAAQHFGASQQPGPQQIGPSTVGGGHDAQSEEGHRRQQKTTLHGSYSL